MKVLIVGTGLMGCSFGLTLQGYGHEIGGYDSDSGSLKEAKELGLISSAFSSLNEGISWADGIILTVPVKAIRTLLPTILDQLTSEQFVVDFGSTKVGICKEVNGHPKRSRFLAAHPIAGTEYSGPKSAFKSLYQEKTMIVCEEQISDPEVLKVFQSWCAYSKMKIVYLSPESHDLHLAYISHLSHVIAYSLSNAVLEKERDGKLILELAGSGFASTVRLAKSSPEMWTSIFLENKNPLVSSIDDLLEKVSILKNAIQLDDEESVKTNLENGREIRKILE